MPVLLRTSIATGGAAGAAHDRDAHGGFWHGYTEPFQDRVFFEAVQRDSLYAGFGAPNAGINTAAQARQHALLYY
jgi:4-hydroxyphenylpyruvate dioxygenase